MNLSQYKLSSRQIKGIQGIQDYAHEQIRVGKKICGKVCSLDNGHIQRIYKQAQSDCEEIAEQGRRQFC